MRHRVYADGIYCGEYAAYLVFDLLHICHLQVYPDWWLWEGKKLLEDVHRRRVAFQDAL